MSRRSARLLSIFVVLAGLTALIAVGKRLDLPVPGMLVFIGMGSGAGVLGGLISLYITDPEEIDG